MFLSNCYTNLKKNLQIHIQVLHSLLTHKYNRNFSKNTVLIPVFYIQCAHIHTHPPQQPATLNLILPELGMSKCRYSLLSNSQVDCITSTASLTQHPSASSSPQSWREKAAYRTQTTTLVPLHDIRLTLLTCALLLCMVHIISPPTTVNAISVQEEKWGFTKAALIWLVTLKAVLITP